MSKWKLSVLAGALLLACTCEANAQELRVEGGDAVLTIIPDTVTIEVPIPVPPDTVFVTDTVEVCPEDWVCTPPPDPTYLVTIDSVEYRDGDTIPAGIAQRFLEDSAGEWRAAGWAYNLTRAPDIGNINFRDENGSRNNESLWPYGIWNERGNWEALPGETYTIIYRINYTDGRGLVEDTIQLHTENPTEPPVPPDTVPPIPPDTAPPGPGDSIQWHLGLMFIDEAGDTTVVRQGQQQPSPMFDASIVEGVYDVWIFEADPGIEPWDSVRVGHPSEERTCTALPCGVYGDDPSSLLAVDSTGLETSLLIAYSVYGDSASRPDKINPWFIEGTLFTIDVQPVPPTPDGLALYSQPCQYPSGSDCTGFYLPADSTYRDGPHSISLYANGSEEIDVDYVTFFARDSNWDRAWTLNDPLPWATFEDSGASWRIPDGIRLNNYDNTRDEEDFWGDVTVGYIAGNIVGDETVVVARDSIVMRIR